MNTKRDEKGTLRIADRIIDVLECFTVDQHEWGVTELANHLGMHKSVIHRILSSLDARGYVRRNPHTKTYTLGLRCLDLGYTVLERMDVRTVALPYMRELVRTVNETVMLHIVDGDQALCIAKVESSQGLKCTSRLGSRVPLHAGAVTKLLLAYLPDEQVERILARPLKRFTEYTVTDPVVLRAQLEQIRRDGYCVTAQEVDLGSIGPAAPIRDHTGAVIASMSVSAPIIRMPDEKLNQVVQLLLATVEQVSGELGYHGPTSERARETAASLEET
ncbi:MAG: IclR family transcriptional regulator [Firmicutes bacterium]|jgi:DNA-binding IclR family transcriptional regulator|nr:IclR family transcriptional regulator [Bacillota bacterium]